MSSAPNLSLALRQGGAFFSTSTCCGRGKSILPRPVPMRTLFSSRIRGHLWGYCVCNGVSFHYVPHQNLDRHRYPSRTLRRYSVSDARKTDSAYLCQRPFRPGVPALSSGAPSPRDVPAGANPRSPLYSATAIRPCRRGHRIGRCLLHRMSQQLALLGPREMSDLSPQSWPKRTFIRSLSPIAML